ncbi:MAG: GntR family transcriptional regulator [Defluviitaleaceae bacterium]|nr:GntR family transcriptional regulator [Defluviitaleaceae bacterium]
MFKIDLKNRKPIYEQVIENFKRQIISGKFTENTRVPSIRDMARELGVNPNTVQKAYRELESQKYFYTVIGQGSFIAAPPEEETSKEVTSLYEKLAGIVRELIFRGESKSEIGLYISNMEDKND